MKVRAGMVAFLVAAGVCAIGASGAWANSITPMCTTDQSGTQPCQSGWYATPVSLLSWTWSSGGTPSNAPNNCQEKSYQTDSTDTVSCTVTWGQSGLTAYYTIQVETSSPTISATAARPPDSNGWYNHPVAVTFGGSAFSGIASCTSSTYSGPSSPTASVAGTCTDNAGKTVGTSLGLEYDDTPPSLSVATDPADRSVALAWQAGGDVAPVASVDVVRAPGLSNAQASTVYRGDSGTFADTRVRDGVRYTYTVTATDQAGNATAREVAVMPGPRLLSPVSNALLSQAPMLSWTPVHGARYYNVQLYRGRKVLSTWPVHARLQLHRTWRFEGHRYRLRPGRYRWYVWPGFGRLAAAHYGRRIGSGTFVVTRT